MNRSRTTAAACSIVTLSLIAAITATAGDLNPPPGPVSPTGPSLADLQNDINNINIGTGGASIGQITTVVDGATIDINANTNEGFASLVPRGESNFEVYFRADTLVGTSTEMAYTDYIEIDSAEISTSTVFIPGPGAGGGSSSPMISSIRIKSTALADRNTSRLFAGNTMGTNVSVDVAFAISAASAIEIMEISFDESYITFLQIDETGYEVEFTPAACVTVTTTDLGPAGQILGSLTTGWNIQTNSPCN